MTAVTVLLFAIYVVLLAAADLDPRGAASKIVFSLIVVLIATTVAVDRRANTHNIKVHVDRRTVELASHVDHRVREVAGRMDRRLTSIGNAMIEHGITLDDTTGEIAKVRSAVEHHTHPVQSGGYDRGYADGLAAAKVQRVSGRASVAPEGHGLDPTVLEMGDRIARRLTDGN